MFQLAIQRDFIAQHFLFGGDWGAENLLHSHHYRVEVLLEGNNLNQHGYLIDIVELENALNQVIALFSDQTLNDLITFHELNPSLERFARIFYYELQQRLNCSEVKLSLKLWENATDWASYCE